MLRLSDAFSWPPTLCTLAFDVGLPSSCPVVFFLVTTLVSYGLNASVLLSDGLPRVLRSNFAAGGDLALELPTLLLFEELFSNGETSGFVGESAPIWLHVCAKSAKGLFFASNCKIKVIPRLLLLFFLWLPSCGYFQIATYESDGSVNDHLNFQQGRFSICEDKYMQLFFYQ